MSGPGKKDDSNKPAMALIPPKGEWELAKAMTNGLKYGKWNYMGGIEATRIISAVKRHVNLFMQGENVAEDSQVHHLAHAAAGCLMLIDILHNNPEMDDRFKKKD